MNTNMAMGGRRKKRRKRESRDGTRANKEILNSRPY